MKNSLFMHTVRSLLLIVMVFTVHSLPVASSSPPDALQLHMNSGPTIPPEVTEKHAISMGIHVIASDENSIVLELTTPTFDVMTVKDAAGSPCQRISVPTYSRSSEPGTPQVPIFGTIVGIPPESAVKLTVVDLESHPLPGTYTLCPVPTPVIEDNILTDGIPSYHGVERRRNLEVYNTDAFSPTLPAEVLSTGYIRSQRVAELRFNPFQYNPVSQQVHHLQRIRVRLDFATSGQGRKDNTPPTTNHNESTFETLLRNTLINYDTARTWRATPSAASPTMQPLSINAEGEVYKIALDAEGIYQLTYSDLQTVGLDVDNIDPRTFQLTNQGQEIAIHVEGETDGTFDPADALIFYGQQVDTKYTDINIYWLTWGGTNGARMNAIDGTPNSGQIPEYFVTNQRIEENHLYQSDRPSGPDGDYWYWGLMFAVAAPVTSTFTSTLQNLATVPVSATVRGLFRGYAATGSMGHHTQVYLNDYLVDDTYWPPQTEHDFEVDIPHSYLVEGENDLTVVCGNGISTGEQDVIFVNRFEIEYAAAHTASDDKLDFNVASPGTWQFDVGNYTTDTLEIFDITHPVIPTRVLSPALTSGTGTYTLTFQHTSAAAPDYIALAEAQRRSPLSITRDMTSTLRSTANGADYIIITHGDFYTAAQTLATYRDNQGLRVALVDVQDVYDEFSHGIFDAEAIHSFLAYTYANWQSPAPTYAVLIGDGNYDPRDYMGRGEPNYIPPYLAHVDPWKGETAADNRYVTVHGDDLLPDIHLGRLPVKSDTAANAMIAKIINYEQTSYTGSWNENVLFAADNIDSAGDFAQFSDDLIANHLPAPYQAEKVYLGVTHPYENPAVTANAALMNAINSGQLLVNYIGHGAFPYWASEKILYVTDTPNFTNTGKLPFVIPMTCLEGYYIIPSASGESNWSSIGESLVRVPDTGAIASWSPTGLGVATGHDIMNRALFNAIFQDDIIELGAATLIGKLALTGAGHDELFDTYVLFGDPALRLNVRPVDVGITTAVTPTDGIHPGETITYTLTYSNAGPAVAHHVVISDSLPLGLVTPIVTYTGESISARTGSTFTWDVADLAAGEGGVITITATVTPPFPMTLNNTATIETSAVETNTTNNNASTNDIPILMPDLVITKKGPVQGEPGETITYTIVYTNVGTALAHQVVISDLLPAPLLAPTYDFDGAALTARPTTSFVWDVVDLPPTDGGVITVTGTISPTFLDVFTNTASIATSDFEHNSNNNTTAPVLTGVQVPDLEVHKTGPATVRPSDIVTYTLTYANVGSNSAPHVVITDKLPPGTTFLNYAGTLTPEVDGNTLTWETFDLSIAAGGILTVSVTISPTYAGTLTNTASITTNVIEPNQANNVTPPVLTEILLPDLALHKTGPTTAYPGDVITYTLTYTNTGNATAAPVTVTDFLPPETTLYDYANTGVMPLGDTIVWEIPSLAPDAHGTLTVAVTISPTFAGTLTNTAAIATALFEPDQTNNVAPPVRTDVLVPDLTVHKTGPATAYPGDIITYTLTYTNTGNATAAPVTITDFLPPETTLYDYANTGVIPLGDTIVWEIPSLAPDAHGTLTVAVTISPTFSGVLTNTAAIATARFEPDQTNNVAPSVQTDVFVPNLTIHKTGPAVTYPGERITYTLTYTNTGDTTAPYVTIVDQLPPVVQLYDHTGTVIMPHPDDQVTWEIFNLAPGGGGTLTVTGVISSAFTGWLTNTATIATTVPELDLADNESYAKTYVALHTVYLPFVVKVFP